jgi:K+-sensing histidine kinase KdpD
LGHTTLKRNITGYVRKRLPDIVKCSLGIGICATTAALLAFFLKDTPDIRFVAPMICLQVVTLVTVLWGRKSGLIGTLLANLIFALFLFPPRGSIVIHDSTERLMLLAFDGCAFCILWLASQKSRGEF